METGCQQTNRPSDTGLRTCIVTRGSCNAESHGFQLSCRRQWGLAQAKDNKGISRGERAKGLVVLEHQVTSGPMNPFPTHITGWPLLHHHDPPFAVVGTVYDQGTGMPPTGMRKSRPWRRVFKDITSEKAGVAATSNLEPDLGFLSLHVLVRQAVGVTCNVDIPAIGPGVRDMTSPHVFADQRQLSPRTAGQVRKAQTGIFVEGSQLHSRYVRYDSGVLFASPNWRSLNRQVHDRCMTGAR